MGQARRLSPIESILILIKKAQLNKIARSRGIHEGAVQKTSNFLDALISQLRAELLVPKCVTSFLSTDG